MATLRQKKAVQNLVESGGKNIGAAMIEAGYSAVTAKNPKHLTDSVGYQDLYSEYGLTNDLIVTSLRDDIKKKKGRRSNELALAARIKGMEKLNVDITTAGQPITNNTLNVEEFQVFLTEKSKEA